MTYYGVDTGVPKAIGLAVSSFNSNNAYYLWLEYIFGRAIGNYILPLWIKVRAYPGRLKLDGFVENKAIDWIGFCAITLISVFLLVLMVRSFYFSALCSLLILLVYLSVCDLVFVQIYRDHLLTSKCDKIKSLFPLPPFSLQMLTFICSCSLRCRKSFIQYEYLIC